MYNWLMTDMARFTILVADDERSNLVVFNHILFPEYTLLTAKTGGEALRRARDETPDLILLDIMMPDMSGFDVLAELKKHESTLRIPVIIVSGLDGRDDRTKGFRLGAAGFITKPVKRGELLKEIEGNIGKLA